MFRRLLRASGPAAREGFQMRGREVSRLECFSDCVFAFALTLLVVALEVPKTFGELMGAMRGFLAFGACFSIFIYLWSKHYVYCRRYGLDDATVRALTAVLLFVVLLYVYPMKFLFRLVVEGLLLGDGKVVSEMRLQSSDVGQLFIVYGLGFAAVLGVFSLLYLHAYRMRDRLGLTPIESFDTRWGIIENLLLISVPTLSILLVLVLPDRYSGLAGYAYGLMGLVGWIGGSAYGAARRRLSKTLEAGAAAPAVQPAGTV